MRHGGDLRHDGGQAQGGHVAGQHETHVLAAALDDINDTLLIGEGHRASVLVHGGQCGGFLRVQLDERLAGRLALQECMHEGERKKKKKKRDMGENL